MVEVEEAEGVDIIKPGGRNAIMNSVVHDHIGVDVNDVEG